MTPRHMPGTSFPALSTRVTNGDDAKRKNLAAFTKNLELLPLDF